MSRKHIDEMLRKIRESVAEADTSRSVTAPSKREIYEALAKESEVWRGRLYEIKAEDGDYDDCDEDDEYEDDEEDEDDE